jgi:sugar-phosphatase
MAPQPARDRVTAILSDLDGVLVDSHASIMRAWRWWGARHRIDAEAIEAIAARPARARGDRALGPASTAEDAARIIDRRTGRRRHRRVVAPARSPRAVREVRTRWPS